MFNPCLQMYGLCQIFSIRESLDRSSNHNGWYVDLRFMGGSHSFKMTDDQVRGLQVNDWCKISCSCVPVDASYDYQGRRVARQAFLPLNLEKVEKVIEPFK